MLSTRDRLFCFPAVAIPALSAFLLGRLIANVGRALQESGLLRNAGAEWVHRFFSFAIATDSHSPLLQSACNWLAIAISVIGFLIVHRLRPDHAFRALVVHLSVSWTVQVILLATGLVAFCELVTKSR